MESTENAETLQKENVETTKNENVDTEKKESVGTAKKESVGTAKKEVVETSKGQEVETLKKKSTETSKKEKIETTKKENQHVKTTESSEKQILPQTSEEADVFDLQRALEDSIDSNLSTTQIIQSKTQGIRIGEKMTEELINIMQNKFMEAPDQMFTKVDFQFILSDLSSAITFPNDEEYDVFFRKMDYRRDDKVDWDEFITYLLLEFQEKDAASSSSSRQLLEPPISCPIKIIRSCHRHPLIRITYCPTVDNDRQMNYHNGKYMTASKDGCIHYWSLDMVLERTVVSTCPELKVNTTWVTDMVCMPDISIVCTSSTERDLRFYDTTAKKFELRVMISSLENAVCCMHYYFSSNVANESKLVLGDMGGSVIIMLFNSESRGPFRQKPGIDFIHLRYEAVLKGHLPGLKVIPYLKIHHDWVCQVAYYPSLKSFVSCCGTPEASMLIFDLSQIRNQRNAYTFNVPSKGIHCFAFDEEIHMVVTGGADSLVRIWNPFVPSKASSTLKGHHAAICAIIIQKETHMIYSLAKDRCIKVWSVTTQTCIQTFTGLTSAIGVHYNTPITTYYNPETHNWMVASMKIALVICDKVLNEIYTDGFTHTKPVIRAMYNPLFKRLVTIGMDSCIMTWDLWLGKCIFLVKRAHTQLMYGDIQEVEITAGTFDPSYTLLLTGARDGTLKIWNFNTGVCIRNLSIEKNCRVTNVIWIPNRILAVGWNRHVTEFADTGSVGDEKKWETRHTEDVLASCVRPPQALVTTSYNGELIFWRLETGQPYKKFVVHDPDKKHKIEYMKSTHKDDDKSSINIVRSSTLRTSILPKVSTSGRHRVSVSKEFKDRTSYASFTSTSRPTSNASESDHAYTSASESLSNTTLYASSDVAEDIPVHASYFLCTRPMLPDWGSLLVSLETGIIQIWSHHKVGGIIAAFESCKGQEDFVICMTSDSKDNYLFTGDNDGYIRVWFVTNFGIPKTSYVSADHHSLRKTFPYYAKKVRANSGVCDTNPILLSSYQGHTVTVTNLEYLEFMQILISCSIDRTVRFWTIGGQYMGTLGSLRPWTRIVPGHPFEMQEFRVPPDVLRIGSEITLKVIGFNYYEKHPSIDSQQSFDQGETTAEKELEHTIYGKPAEEPILGTNFILPSRGVRILYKPKVDINLGPNIQVYSHIRTYDLAEIKEIPMPSGALVKPKQKARAKINQLTEASSRSTITTSSTQSMDTSRVSQRSVKN